MVTGGRQDTHWWKETAFYFIMLQFLEKRVKPDLNSSMKSFSFFVQYCIPLSVCLWHAKKDTICAWIVDHLSWTSTTHVLETSGRFPRKHFWLFLYKRAWNFILKKDSTTVVLCLGKYLKMDDFWQLGTFTVEVIQFLTIAISFSSYCL